MARGSVGFRRRGTAALKSEEMKEGPGAPQDRGISAPASFRAHQGMTAGGGPAALEEGPRVGEGGAPPAEGQRRAGRCGSASGLSRISLLLGLSWKEPEGRKKSLPRGGTAAWGIQGSRPAKWLSHPPARSGGSAALGCGGPGPRSSNLEVPDLVILQ